jgi:hypothetical protein
MTRTPSDFGELLADHARLSRELDVVRTAAKDNARVSTSKLVAIGTLVVGLANAPALVELAKPRPAAATREDIASLRSSVDALATDQRETRAYLRERDAADARWRGVVGSALERQGMRVRGSADPGVTWQPTNAHGAVRAADPRGVDVEVEFPAAPSAGAGAP